MVYISFMVLRISLSRADLYDHYKVDVLYIVV